MTENKRYSFNWERGHPNFWDNYCDLADCYLTCEDVVNKLNELDKENRKLKNELNLSKLNLKEKNEGFDKLHKMYMEQIEENKELHEKNQFLNEKEKDMVNYLKKEYNYVYNQKRKHFDDAILVTSYELIEYHIRSMIEHLERL